jgi:UDP-N-acetyl-D-glucosamine dehydrogenase
MGKSVKGSRVLVLGLTYKKDVNDIRESPALDIIHLLIEKGAHVSYHDPYVPSFNYDGLSLSVVDDLESALRCADCVMIATDHTSYDWALVRQQATLIVDCRHVVTNVA